MKNKKLFRIVWISGIYIILLLILYLVVLYKVKWENKDLNTYLYFYDCDHNLCSTMNKPDDYYSKFLCEDDVCPYINSIIDNNLILTNGDTSFIYDYYQGIVINNDYVSYRYIGKNIYVVTDENNKQGVINLNGEVLVQPKYEYIDDYKNGFISYRKENLYGVDNIDNKVQISPSYDDVVLINDNILAVNTDNIYTMRYYSNFNNVNDNKYDYVYAYDDVILVINNNKLDILNTELESTLLMKINTFYSYKIEKERDSLDIYFDDGNLYFTVYLNEGEYTIYKYNLNTKKLS